MSVQRPYFRTCRQFSGGYYADGGASRYIDHRQYAQSPEHYIRAFLILQQDVKSLFEYVEPSDTNLKCYSFRIHELLFRICIEIEANCKAILSENGYSRNGNWNITDYQKIETSHRLSSYLVKVPFWAGTFCIRTPFKAWKNREPLPWYQAYNESKHDRINAFARATFECMTDAFAGLSVLLSSQFYTHDFSSGSDFLAADGSKDGMEAGIGEYLRVQFPNDWPLADRYDFRWDDLADDPNPFQQFDYAKVT